MISQLAARCFSPRSLLDAGFTLHASAFHALTLQPFNASSLQFSRLTFYSQTDYDYEHEFFIRLPRRCVVKAGASTSHFSPITSHLFRACQLRRPGRELVLIPEIWKRHFTQRIVSGDHDCNFSRCSRGRRPRLLLLFIAFKIHDSSIHIVTL